MCIKTSIVVGWTVGSFAKKAQSRNNHFVR
jgi:hypothetical protein